jgi:hypothetical protein
VVGVESVGGSKRGRQGRGKERGVFYCREDMEVCQSADDGEEDYRLDRVVGGLSRQRLEDGSDWTEEHPESRRGTC